MLFFRGIIAAFLFVLPVSAVFAADRITTPVDAARTVVLKGNTRPEARAQNDQGAADAGMEIAYATLLLKLDPSIESFLAEQQTPGSASYRRWLTPEQFGDRFGLSGNDLAKVTAWLQSQGLRINDVARGRHWVTFSGTAEKIGHALNTEIHNYLVNGERHFANATDPSIPEALQGVVGGFRGLNDFRPQSMLVRAPKQPDPVTPHYNSGTNHFLAPDDLATMFDIQALYDMGIDGTGQTLVIAGQTDVSMLDFRVFQVRYGINLNLPKLMLFGPDPGTRGDLIEADLDLEWSTAVARGANIVYAYSTNVFTSAQYAVDQNLGQTMSISYGDCESYNSVAYRAIAQQANAQGMTIFVSSGDAGAATCDRDGPVPLATHGATASWPSSFPEITSVGGTELNDSGGKYWAAFNNATDASALSYIPEVPWNDSVVANTLEGGGGAPSVLFSKPVWQTGPGVPNDGARDLPDISLPASPYKYAYLVQSGGSLNAVGGTSASSPAWAGIATLLNQYLTMKGVLAQPGLGNINPALYRLAQATTDVFHDVTTGDNKVPCEQSTANCVDGLVGFAAGPGYDLATGLGSVDVLNFVTEWTSGTSSVTTLGSQPTSAGLTDTVQLIATVTGGGAASPSGSVDFIANDVNLGTAALTPSAAGKSTATLSVAGNQIAIGNGTVTSLYGGDGVYTGSQGSASIAITIPATSGSFVVPWVSPNPVPQQGGNLWPYTVGLTEKAGVATSLTGFTVNGAAQNLSLWTSTSLPANGSINAQLEGAFLTPPLNRLFVFNGRDANGAAWTQQITVPFVAPTGSAIMPQVTLSTATPTVLPNSGGGPFCEWSPQLTVQETGGYLMLLTRLTVGGVDITSQLPEIFGTTRLAPLGMLEGNPCIATTAAGAKTFQLTTSTVDGQIGETLTVTTSAILESATATSTSTLSVSPQSVVIPANSSPELAGGSINVNFSGGNPAWTASIVPNNSSMQWLTIGTNQKVSAAGSGDGTVPYFASAAGLSPGAYTATIVIQSATSSPQFISVPVTLVVGQSANSTIAGVANNFSGSTTVAPGEIAAVFGTQMSPTASPAIATRLPLPFTLNGVTATVNGVSAPLYYVSPGQINLQIPYETGAGTAMLAINNNGQIATFPLQVAATAPGLYAAAFDALTGQIVTSANQGQILVLYMTGEGDVTPTLATGATPLRNSNPANYPTPRQTVAVTVGDAPAQVLFVGIPNGIAGASQINFTVPSNAPLGMQAVTVTVGAAASQTIMLTIGVAQNIVQ